jgi:hypothetical protein
MEFKIMMPEDQLAAAVVRRGNVYLYNASRIQDKAPHFAGYNRLWSAACVLAAIPIALLSPDRPSGLPNLCPLSISIALMAALGGASAGWATFAIQAVWLAWEIGIHPGFLSWFAEVLLTWAAIPAVAAVYEDRRRRSRRAKSSSKERVPSSSDIG